MKQFGKVLFWGGVLLILALLVWGVGLVRGWPFWLGCAVFVGVIGLYFLARYLRRVWVIYRTRSRLARLEEREMSGSLPSDPTSEIRRNWRNAIRTLRRSSLRRRGHPLYVLPWYMVIGRSGAGKTSALTRARLSSPIQRINHEQPVAQTRDYDWWYFDQAVMIDCAGRYVAREDLEADRKEWERGLDYLARYRPRAGLDGLVLVVSANALLTDPDATLISDARTLRLRIEQLIRLFGKRFPVYVLVTQCDRLYGFEAWAKLLPEHALSQAMGYMSEGVEAGENEQRFLAEAFARINDRLDALATELVAKMEAADITPAFLLFPKEFSALASRLQLFLQHCMSEDPYLEKPLLRGLFFSSARQDGGAVSQLMGADLPAEPIHPPTHDGWFLADLFSRVLPSDRGSWRPAVLKNQWQRLTRDTGLVSLFALSLAMVILMCVSFAGNLGTLSLLAEAKPWQMNVSGNVPAQVHRLLDNSEVLLMADQRDRAWRNGWMIGTNQVHRLQDTLKVRFRQQYLRQIAPVIRQLAAEDTARAMAMAPGDPGRAMVIANRVRWINLMLARTRGANLLALEAMPGLRSSPFFPQVTAQGILRLQLVNLAWTPANSPDLQRALQLARQELATLAMADGQMRWLIGMVPDDVSVPTVNRADFWSSVSIDRAADFGVAAVYTLTGQNQVQQFLQEMAMATDNLPDQFQQYRNAFQAWYMSQRLNAWQTFTGQFVLQGSPVMDEQQSLTVLSTIASAQSPFFLLMKRLSDEFASLPLAEAPGWLADIRLFERLRLDSLRYGSSNAAVTMVGAVNSAGGDAVEQLIQGAPGEGALTIKYRVGALTALAAYIEQLRQLSQAAATSPARAYTIAADLHNATHSSTPAPSSISQITADLHRFQQLVGPPTADSLLAWQLLEGPWRFLLTYAERQASCVLQQSWQTDVLNPAQGTVGKTALSDQLFGSKGLVWAFTDGIAKPFLLRSDMQFRPAEVNGMHLPFSPPFLTFLNGIMQQRVSQLSTQQQEAAQQQLQQIQNQQTIALLDRSLADTKQQLDAINSVGLPLTIGTVPLAVNNGAKAKPWAALLSIACATGVQTLDNYNSSIKKTMTWVPAQCADVSLRIKVSNLVLSRNWVGPLGVADFLQAFNSGTLIFSADDFPAETSRLLALGIRHIQVSYTFDGQWAVIARAQRLRELMLAQATATRQKQALQDQQFQQSQQSVQQKLVDQQTMVSDSPSGNQHLWIPPQVGECWQVPATAKPMTAVGASQPVALQPELPM